MKATGQAFKLVAVIIGLVALVVMEGVRHKTLGIGLLGWGIGAGALLVVSRPRRYLPIAAAMVVVILAALTRSMAAGTSKISVPLSPVARYNHCGAVGVQCSLPPASLISASRARVLRRTLAARSISGRRAVRRAPRVVRTVLPSARPMMSSCAMTPACVWNWPPSSNTTR